MVASLFGAARMGAAPVGDPDQDPARVQLEAMHVLLHLLMRLRLEEVQVGAPCLLRHPQGVTSVVVVTSREYTTDNGGPDQHEPTVRQADGLDYLLCSRHKCVARQFYGNLHEAEQTALFLSLSLCLLLGSASSRILLCLFFSFALLCFLFL